MVNRMKKTRKQKGMFLISSYLVLSVIGTFSIALFLNSTAAYRVAKRTQNRIIAFHLAESGLDRAIVALRTDPTYTGQGYTALGNQGGFDVQVVTSDPANPTVRQISARGYAPNNAAASYAYQSRQVVAHLSLAPQLSGPYALFSNTSIQMSGNAGTDSYDSRNGLYNPNTAGANGSIRTNTTGAGMVMMSGNVRIRGDAVVGPGGNPASVIQTSGNVVIEGSRTAAPVPQILDPVVVPSGLTNLGALSLNGNNALTLSGGTYLYSSLSVTGNGRINFTGPATIYVTGNVSLSGNGVGTAQNLPTNLTIKTLGASVSLSGNAAFYGSLYAPSSGVSVTGNGDVFGSVVGNTIQVSGNGKFHYDEALSQSPTSSAATTRLLAWTES